jgi:hypothetical protein
MTSVMSFAGTKPFILATVAKNIKIKSLKTIVC